ncbi:hypothetical protein PPACK8108_LOCUS16743 [Phakopsora pachyrhizi]|uniref:CSC1/OSCA1-like N-terminal transmembrane domain-containing protein n=1 Tax=Phakopsora pachyrhizi TaxID=170000 RepID=A0AAV0B9T4_PHAPC|nr:hypothetical protein PPACK8108_LOCUS16743 [Phakopsora pachyrhizi]
MSVTDSAASGLLIQYQAKLAEVSTGAVVIQLGTLCSTNTTPSPYVLFLHPHRSCLLLSVAEEQDCLHASVQVQCCISEDELVTKIRMDAVIFLRLLRMCRWMCGLMAGLAMAILLPCDLVYNLKNSPTTTFAGNGHHQPGPRKEILKQAGSLSFPLPFFGYRRL